MTFTLKSYLHKLSLLATLQFSRYPANWRRVFDPATCVHCVTSDKLVFTRWLLRTCLSQRPAVHPRMKPLVLICYTDCKAPLHACKAPLAGRWLSPCLQTGSALLGLVLQSTVTVRTELLVGCTGLLPMLPAHHTPGPCAETLQLPTCPLACPHSCSSGGWAFAASRFRWGICKVMGDISAMVSAAFRGFCMRLLLFLKVWSQPPFVPLELIHKAVY